MRRYFVKVTVELVLTLRPRLGRLKHFRLTLAKLLVAEKRRKSVGVRPYLRSGDVNSIFLTLLLCWKAERLQVTEAILLPSLEGEKIKNLFIKSPIRQEGSSTSHFDLIFAPPPDFYQQHSSDDKG